MEPPPPSSLARLSNDLGRGSLTRYNWQKGRGAVGDASGSISSSPEGPRTRGNYYYSEPSQMKLLLQKNEEDRKKIADSISDSFASYTRSLNERNYVDYIYYDDNFGDANNNVAAIYQEHLSEILQRTATKQRRGGASVNANASANASISDNFKVNDRVAGSGTRSSASVTTTVIPADAPYSAQQIRRATAYPSYDTVNNSIRDTRSAIAKSKSYQSTVSTLVNNPIRAMDAPVIDRNSKFYMDSGVLNVNNYAREAALARDYDQDFDNGYYSHENANEMQGEVLHVEEDDKEFIFPSMAAVKTSANGPFSLQNASRMLQKYGKYLTVLFFVSILPSFLDVNINNIISDDNNNGVFQNYGMNAIVANVIASATSMAAFLASSDLMAHLPQVLQSNISALGVFVMAGAAAAFAAAGDFGERFLFLGELVNRVAQDDTLTSYDFTSTIISSASSSSSSNVMRNTQRQGVLKGQQSVRTGTRLAVGGPFGSKKIPDCLTAQRGRVWRIRRRRRRRI